MPGVEATEWGEAGVLVELDDLSRVPDLIAALTAAGARLTRVTPREPSLEELYFAVRSGHLDARPEATASIGEAEATASIGEADPTTASIGEAELAKAPVVGPDRVRSAGVR